MVLANERYWDRARETMPVGERNALILQRLRRQLRHAYDNAPFYRRLYDAHGLDVDAVRTLSDFTRMVPVVTKDMLRQSQSAHPPFGDYLGVPRSEIARVQGTSGTTGRPTLFAISKDDWAHIAEAQAMQCWAAGMRPDDLFQIAFPLSLYVGGWGLLHAAERIGASVLPMAGGSAERQILMIQTAKPTAICGTPTFLIHILEVAQRDGVDLSASGVRLAFLGGEPGGSIPAVRRIIEAGFGAAVIDFGNVAELHPCSNMECDHHQGMHAYQDVDYAEVVAPDDPHAARAMGERGAVVYTHLWRRSQPMIRYFPGDETVMTDEPCGCGRTYPRLPLGVIGRLDDLLIVRGVKFYPADVEGALRSCHGMGGEFRIHLFRQSALDGVRVEAEVSAELLAAAPPAQKDMTLSAFARRAEAALRREIGLNIPVLAHPPNHYPRDGFKARRVRDERASLDVLDPTAWSGKP